MVPDGLEIMIFKIVTGMTLFSSSLALEPKGETVLGTIVIRLASLGSELIYIYMQCRDKGDFVSGIGGET